MKKNRVLRLCEVSDQVQDKISNQMNYKMTQKFLSKNKSEQIINKICLFILFKFNKFYLLNGLYNEILNIFE
jgi:hypothetical protein